MDNNKIKNMIGTPVVSVRLNRDLVRRLDALVARTGRSRGFYLRTAIADMLPALEAHYWAHEAVNRIQTEDRRFGAIMADLNTPQIADPAIE
ncbi:MAG: ribbon-helix-helix domain-containing protein [Propionibacteriaceae bacterium]|jgi:predicted DNA-binding protein|nr:ribbon-helix-helix protein, CopG family [Micropruina sp.]